MSKLKYAFLILSGVIFVNLCALEAAAESVKIRSGRYSEYYKAMGGVDEVYYDYVEGGRLRGGRKVIELDEPGPVVMEDTRETWEVNVIQDSGLSVKRFDIAVLGDGYTDAERTLYADHVDRGIAGFFNELPLNVYRNYFNIHRVEVISNESGVDVPDDGIYVDTALDMRFSGRLLTISTSKAFEAAGSAREFECVLAFGNTSIYGGAGYSNLATASGDNYNTEELVLHEMGHSLAKLADEYDYGGDETYTGSEPTQINVSIYTAAEQVAMERKWYRWMDLPNVDTFEGAMYSVYGIYRPTDNSLMRSLNRPFEEVNVEQWIFKIYEQVALIDDVTPSSPVPLPGYTEFFVTPIQPIGHSLDIQWSIDSVPIAGANGTTFRPDSVPLSRGLHRVSLNVIDNTPMVRDEAKRQELMRAGRKWVIESWGEDLTKDYRVGIEDFGFLAGRWMQTGCNEGNGFCDGASLDFDGDVDADDLQILVGGWLGGTLPAVHYKFDESEGLVAYDSSLQGRDGALVNMEGSEWTGSPRGNCLEFDGVDDYVEVTGYKGIPFTNPRTCAAWIKTEAYRGEIVSWGNTEGTAKWIVRVDDAGPLRAEIQTGSIIGTTDLADNAWHHVAVVLDDDGSINIDDAKLYVDGVEEVISSSSPREVETNGGTDVNVGRFYASERFFDGLIDEVRIYERALIGEEVGALANQ
jgi:hypothetical protein